MTRKSTEFAITGINHLALVCRWLRFLRSLAAAVVVFPTLQPLPVRLLGLHDIRLTRAEGAVLTVAAVSVPDAPLNTKTVGRRWVAVRVGVRASTQRNK